MSLPNPKDLKAIFQVCRKAGVTDLEIGEIKVKFGELPREPGEQQEADEAPLGPSDEQLAYWSTHDPMQSSDGAPQ